MRSSSEARLVESYRAMLEGINPQRFITLTFNRDVNLLIAHRDVHEFCKRLERVAHGKRWTKYPSEARLVALGFVEHVESNLHYHLLARGSAQLMETVLQQGDSIWRDLTKTGQAECEIIRTKRGAARYVTKALTGERAFDAVVVYGTGTRAR